jgi:hypothetical protein
MIPGWKGLPGRKHSSLFGFFVSDQEGKSFINLSPGSSHIMLDTFKKSDIQFPLV